MDILFPGRRVIRIELDGRVVDAVFRLDVGEHERRARFDLGAMSYPRLLRRLEGMPAGVLVEDPVLAAETNLLPDGVVAWSSSGVGRLVEPPLTLDAVVVPALRTAQTRHIRVAERFAPYTSRWVVSGDPRIDPAVFVAASIHGVGLAVRRPEVDVVAEAAPPAGRTRPGHAWLLAEQVYGAWLAAVARAGSAESLDAGSSDAESSEVAPGVGDTPAGLIPAT
ncbi:hypothetical protein BCD49_35095 [Pseudofrankia sp. EUN1h]|nr:hypothetical protein BCD49_35095 [Pseudofrankia sp. EUN1h]